jgi:hypothetical protein
MLFEFAYSVFPSLFGHFLEKSLDDKAAAFLDAFFTLARAETELQFAMHFFSAYFQGCYYFQDLLWSSFSVSALSSDSYSFDIGSLLISAVSTASSHLTHHLELLQTLNSKSHELALNFVVNDVLLSSLSLFRTSFTDSHLFTRIRDFLSESGPVRDQIYEAFFNRKTVSLNLPSFCDMALPSGTPFCFHTSSFVLLLTELIGIDFFIPPGLRQPACNDIAGLKKNPDSKAFVAYICFAMSDGDCSPSRPSNPQNPEFARIWDRLRQTSIENAEDPLLQLPLLSAGDQLLSDPILSSPEFTLFALQREKELLEANKLLFERFVFVSRCGKLLSDFCCVLETILGHAINASISDLLAIPDKKQTKIANVVSLVRTAIASGSSRGFDLAMVQFPVLCAILDNIQTFPNSSSSLLDEFGRLSWNFEGRSADNDDYRRGMGQIHHELVIFRQRMRLIVDCPCGKQFAEFVAIADAVSTTAQVFSDYGLQIDARSIFGAIVPADAAAGILGAIVRLGRLHLKFSEDGFAPWVREFEQFRSIVAWMLGLLEEHKEFLLLVHKTISRAWT